MGYHHLAPTLDMAIQKAITLPNRPHEASLHPTLWPITFMHAPQIDQETRFRITSGKLNQQSQPTY